MEIDQQHDNDIVEFQAQVTELIADTKNKKTDEAQASFKNLSDTIQELDNAKKETLFKIS